MAAAAQASTAFSVDDESTAPSIHAGSFADQGAVAAAFRPLPVHLGEATYSSAWKWPNSLPCRQEDGSNPCWDGDDIFNRAVETGQSSAPVISQLRSDFAEGRFTVDEICDGDVISNSGVRDGRAFYIPREGVAFDRDWLESQGLEHRTLADGRSCVPSQSYGSWHFVHACGNAVQVLSRFDPDAPRRRPAARLLGPAAPIEVADARVAPPARGPFGGGGFGGGGFFFGGGGGSSSGGEEITPLLPIEVIRPPVETGEGGDGPQPPLAPPTIDIEPPFEVAPPPVMPVPAPAPLLLLMTGLGALIAAARRRRA